MRKKEPTYSQQTLKTPNPIARFAHNRRYSHSIAMTLKYVKNNSVLLDYGCGEGDFLNKVSKLKNDLVLCGYDPESEQTSKLYNILTDTKGLDDESVDLFCSFETLEHLYQHEKELLYTEANRLVKTNGVLIISIPIIGGPTLFLKELNRVYLFKRKSDYSFRELLLSSLLGISAKRPSNPRITHKGFDFRIIEEELSKKFKLVEKKYSPFSHLPWYLNSQVFYRLEKSSL